VEISKRPCPEQVVVPSPLMKECGHCGKTPKPLLRCSQCIAQVYCDAACQREDWKSHKNSCQSKFEVNVVNTQMPRKLMNSGRVRHVQENDEEMW
jgi:hypothetical protein